MLSNMSLNPVIKVSMRVLFPPMRAFNAPIEEHMQHGWRTVVGVRNAEKAGRGFEGHNVTIAKWEI
jgi:hypothetical protein